MLIPCVACDRHVQNDDLRCPFCGSARARAPVPPDPVVPRSRSAIMDFRAGAAAAALGIAACGSTDPAPLPPEQTVVQPYGAPLPPTPPPPPPPVAPPVVMERLPPAATIVQPYGAPNPTPGPTPPPTPPPTPAPSPSTTAPAYGGPPRTTMRTPTTMEDAPRMPDELMPVQAYGGAPAE